MNKLSIEDILSGALVGKPELIEVDIVVNGKPCTFETYIKIMDYDTAKAQMEANTEGREGLASILADCIVTEDGQRIFTEEQVRQKFNKHLIDALWAKILEKNFLGKLNTPKKSSGNLRSGQNSSKVVSRGRRSAKQKQNLVIENSSSGNNIDSGEEVST
ncbi:phage tail assembly chaperone family protein, TAC [Acinetobacter baumannii]|uniref:phage tail assembly chaperone family protein, TAC n=1 Tax=Acinetobacter baumannii TaxID=470 RepID=UPI0015809A3A|nr:phage tail assembly chaperone family protein, TAC [Acinetobacter baumannii]NUF19342.1 phage tail assembly chaperone family protein, TAC [Acinetobacter baumannii]